MKTTLTNDFHNTEAAFIAQRITEGRFAGKYKISRKTAMRLRRELCGVEGCICGDEFGARPGAPIRVITEDHERNYIINPIVDDIDRE